ncbi:MAG TPA: ABC-2 family transporter protein [Armatimonadota bacterium]|jgi:ABC-2 type transport system permease protein
MRRYLRLFGMFVRTCLVKELEFRGNFWVGSFVGAAWVGVYLAVAHIIYSNTSSVGGWSKGQMVMLLGTYTLSFGLISVFFSRNLAELPNQVRTGTFDFTLVKPVNSQFFVSLRYLNFTEFGTVAAATALVVYGAVLGHVHITVLGALEYVAMLTCGVVIFYCIYLLMMTSAFWFVKVDNLWTLAETVTQVARTPMNIYGLFAQRFFTFVLPLIFIAHIPAKALFRGVEPREAALAVTMCVALLFVSSRFWNFATRFYSSASS